ncbi:hypothetical protein C3F09_02495 [candidate division GN15 bacterium]|uniref:Type 4 fimbrial biogenesis protein PilX N-terminal domain-containing protein n=1 Tax=candidate division GN15 bacterium TaxID=2072418 RepID=A0A855XB75_9BACT|nr:MAG: hypothetical protein C3F09_02495 [candidate division GN15 bacterium]
MSCNIRNQTGSALLVVLMLVFMLSLLGIAAIDTSNVAVDLSFNRSHSDETFYIAEAGAKLAFMTIRNNPQWDTGYTHVAFGSGFYSVNVIDSSDDPALVDTIIVTSNGSNEYAKSTVRLILVPLPFHPFRTALFGDSCVDIRNSMSTDSYNSDSGSYVTTVTDDGGDVGSNGIIDIKNGAVINGDVTTSLADGAIVNPGSIVTGTVTTDAAEQHLPAVMPEDLNVAEATSIAGTGISGDYTYNATTKTFRSDGNCTLASGVYYFTDLVLDNSASLSLEPGAEVVIYVEGDIEIKNSGGINDGGVPENLLIFSTGDLVLKNSGNLYGVFYSPEATCDLRNSGSFFGAVVARNIIGHSSASFHYDRNLGNITKGTADIGMIGWKEL